MSDPPVSTPVLAAAASPPEPAVEDDGDDLFASPSSDLPVKKEPVSAPVTSTQDEDDEVSKMP